MLSRGGRSIRHRASIPRCSSAVSVEPIMTTPNPNVVLAARLSHQPARRGTAARTHRRVSRRAGRRRRRLHGTKRGRCWTEAVSRRHSRGALRTGDHGARASRRQPDDSQGDVHGPAGRRHRGRRRWRSDAGARRWPHADDPPSPRDSADSCSTARLRDVVEWAEGGMPRVREGHTHRGPSKDGPGEINVPIACAGLAVQSRAISCSATPTASLPFPPPTRRRSCSLALRRNWRAKRRCARPIARSAADPSASTPSCAPKACLPCAVH